MVRCLWCVAPSGAMTPKEGCSDAQSNTMACGHQCIYCKCLLDTVFLVHVSVWLTCVSLVVPQDTPASVP